MTPALLQAISLAPDKTQLEDLYLPYKPKRRSKAQIALEAGLEPLADALLANPMLNPDEAAARYLRDPFATEQGDNPGVADAKAALDGARQILMERFAEDAGLLQSLREYVQEHGVVEFRVGEARTRRESTPITSLFGKTLHTVPGTAAGALPRAARARNARRAGASTGGRAARLGCAPTILARAGIASRFGIQDRRPADRWLMDTVRSLAREHLHDLELETDE